MPQLKGLNQTLQLAQIRELKPGIQPDEALRRSAANGLDEVVLAAEGKHYLAVGEQLALNAIKGQATVQLELGGHWIEASVLGQQDDISSWSEGWAKGTSLGESLSLAWQGFGASQSWESIHAISTGLSRWPSVAKTPDPIPVSPQVPDQPGWAIHPADTTAQPVPVAPPVSPTPVAPSPGAADPNNSDPEPGINAGKPRIEVFFTTPGQVNPRDPSVALAELIGSAKRSVDIAAFELDNHTIRDAILKAHADGRKVRVVTDSDYAHEPDLQALITAGIEVIEDKRSGLMHNKFVVIDHGTPEAAVWTGSMNMTDNCVTKNNNNSLLIRSPELAANFHMEFEEMFVAKAFGITSPNAVPHPRVTVGKTLIETHFAAEGRVAGKVAEALNRAEQSIHFMAFSFTHDAIGQVVAQKLTDPERPVTVRGVFEKTGSGTQYSEYGKLKALGADVRTDGNPKILHHKVFVIDGKTVITGSFNFSDSADQKNDENLLIIEDPELAKQYLAEFNRVYQNSVSASDQPDDTRRP